jgi:hypothetical protein
MSASSYSTIVAFSHHVLIWFGHAKGGDKRKNWKNKLGNMPHRRNTWEETAEVREDRDRWRGLVD